MDTKPWPKGVYRARQTGVGVGTTAIGVMVWVVAFLVVEEVDDDPTFQK